MTVADVVVVGGGIIGLSVAWRALGHGWSVVVVDPAPGQGASHAAAGMLAPVTEACIAEEPLTRLGLTSAGLWPGFAEELSADAGGEVGLRREGTLQVAFDDDDRRQLDELAAVHRVLGLDSERVTTRQCRQLVPLLSPRIRAGLLVPGDWQVDPRRVTAALLRAVAARGGTVRPDTVSALRRRRSDGPVEGVVLAGGETLDAAAVVLAAGTGTPGVAGVPAAVRLPVRPVKGEILRLRSAAAPIGLDMTVRATVQGQAVYVVARENGEVVVGATAQEAGYDTSVRAGAVLELLRAAIELIPALGELGVAEVGAALRPATPDNAPLIGPTAVDGLHAATGHYRNGVLLAPVTADLVVAGIASGRLPGEAAAFSARRFS